MISAALSFARIFIAITLFIGCSSKQDLDRGSRKNSSNAEEASNNTASESSSKSSGETLGSGEDPANVGTDTNQNGTSPEEENDNESDGDANPDEPSIMSEICTNMTLLPAQPDNPSGPCDTSLPPYMRWGGHLSNGYTSLRACQAYENQVIKIYDAETKELRKSWVIDRKICPGVASSGRCTLGMSFRQADGFEPNRKYCARLESAEGELVSETGLFTVQ